VSEEIPSQPVLKGLVAGYLSVESEGLTLRPSRTGKFNSTFFVEGCQTPLVLRVAPPEDRSRLLSTNTS
jgi:hypothetical protein